MAKLIGCEAVLPAADGGSSSQRRANQSGSEQVASGLRYIGQVTQTSSSAEKQIWDEWKRITRFLESARIAFAREEVLWRTLEVGDRKSLLLTTSEGKSRYSVKLDDHLRTIRDHDVLFALVLGATYALAESYGRLKLDLSDDDDLSGGVEAWGGKLLAATGHSWGDVLDGLAGIVEVSAVRNAYAHGARAVNQKIVNRFVAHGLACPWALEDRIDLPYEKVETYRARIKSLMRFGNQKKRGFVAAVPPPTPSARNKKAKKS